MTRVSARKRFAVGANIRVKTPGINGVVTQLDDVPTVIGEYWHTIKTEHGERREPGSNLELIPTPMTNERGGAAVTETTKTLARKWDVFISYASEDQEKIAHSLANALKDRGYDVWYAPFSLKLGDSLRASIDRGLAESRFGVVILSKHFFAKHWPIQELNGLAALEARGERVILPVWHGVTQADVAGYSPMLADRKAVNTTDGLQAVVAAIEEVINPPMNDDVRDLLHDAEERLREYHCPFCKSPLSSRGSVELSEDDSGTFEAFECGYSHIDGEMKQPCPSDPKFPRLDDYEFAYRELVGDSHWKWECIATGKTNEARQLFLNRGLGRTKEEARQNVEEWYWRYAKPWKG